MPTMSPYKLQIWLPREMETALTEVAHAERSSKQKLVEQWLLARLKEHPAAKKFVRDLPLEER